MMTISEALEQVDRKIFIPTEYKHQSSNDTPIPIGYGQTISQPTTVRLMLTWLNVKEGDKILDIGSGSGYTSALLSHLAGKTGKVFAVEIIPELLETGKENCRNANCKNIEFVAADKTIGYPSQAPYNKILVSASAENLPQTLLDQLAPGGTMVIPVKNDVLEIIKISDQEFKTVNHPGFIFVPLISSPQA